MTTQLGLFAAPRTHTGDPPTSHRAEARSKPRAKAHAAIVLALVRSTGGATASQIAGLLEGHPAFALQSHERLCQVRRRLSDLRGAGLVERRTLKGSTEAVWYAKEPGA